jgi:hypothetical protein
VALRPANINLQERQAEAKGISILCTEYNAGRCDDSAYKVSTTKGLLSIPSDGGGARRPLGQSFRESVGPAALYQVSAANRRDHLLIRLAYEYAVRATEVCSLHVQDFDMCTDTVYLQLERFKGSNTTVQPLMPCRLIVGWHSIQMTGAGLGARLPADACLNQNDCPGTRENSSYSCGLSCTGFL